MNLFSDKACYPRHITQYLISNLGFGTSVKSAQDAQVKSLSKDYSFEIYRDVRDLPSSWSELVQNRNSFLKTPFLTALQESPPTGLENRYIILKLDSRIVGIVLVQLIDYRLKDTLKNLAEEELQTWSDRLKFRLSSVLNFRLLVIGNLLLSGEHAFLFNETLLSREQGVDLILRSLPHIRQQIEQADGQRISGVMIKDLESPLTANQRKGLMYQVTFQPNMSMKLAQGWNSKEDYLADLQSKYRVRARRASKKAKGVKIREWSLAEIESERKTLHELYRAIADKATFNMLHLEADYLPALKRELGEAFRFFGYENQNGELIGFCTLIQNGEAYDAHFLGLEETANKQHQLYLNMLFDMLEKAIEKPEIKSIVFGRTALEIKSSIGARPKEMYCYIKHFNPVFNLVIGWLIRRYDPVEEWQARHPFKTAAADTLQQI